jgi:peroxiredoxin
METNEQSPIYRYGRRAYFIVDRQGTVRYVKVQANPLDVLKADEVLNALRQVATQ